MKGKGKQQPNAEKAKELCNLYNTGKTPCAGSAECSFGRLHRCKQCDGSHPADKCDWSGPKKNQKKRRGGRGSGANGGGWGNR